MMSQDLNVSFVIVTNGNRDGLLHTVIEGIKYQNIPTYEIVVVGKSKIKEDYPEVNYIEEEDLADAGLLGAMITVACSHCKHDNIVISDDDMILSLNWYEELKKSESFLCSLAKGGFFLASIIPFTSSRLVIISTIYILIHLKQGLLQRDQNDPSRRRLYCKKN